MASKKKSKTRSTAKSARPVRGRVTKAKINRKPGKKRSARKRVAVKTKGKGKKGKRAIAVNAENELKREFRSRTLAEGTRTPARQSEDFEGLSRAEQADSESVDELVEEGNLFEAGAVTGVQEADGADEREVHTHELPEDDVPEEYLDKD